MRKLSALVVIAAILCSGTAFAMEAWDWDVTCRASTNADEAGIPDGYWFYEYAWEMIENDSDGFPSTPKAAYINIGSAPGLLFNVYGDSEAPDKDEYDAVPDLDSLDVDSVGTYTETWLNGLGWTEFTGGYWLNTPGFVFDSPTFGRSATWTSFTIDENPGGAAQDPGLAFYTSFLAPRPPMQRKWYLDDGALASGTVCAPTPEPASALLLLLGLPAAAALRKRRE